MKIKIGIVAFSLMCCMIITGFSFFMGVQDEEKNQPAVQPKPQESGQAAGAGEVENYSMEAAEGNQNLFVNYVDGYSLLLPKDLQPDMSQPQIRTVLKNDNLQIEIYLQKLGADVSPETYISYSNKFMENTVNHKQELEGDFEAAGMPAHVLQWSRTKLRGVAADKNYYASVDVQINRNEVATFFFKSAVPFLDKEQYLNLVQSFYKHPVEAGAQQPLKTPAVVSSDACKSWSKETKAAYKRYFSDDSSLTWGIFEPDAPEDFAPLDQLEGQLDYQFPFLVYYKHFNQKGESENLSEGLQNAKARGRIPELTLQTTALAEGSGNMVYDILNGEYDAFLDSFIGDIKGVQTPVLMRFCNEMNGDWCMYSSFHTSKDTELFKELYKYVYEKFREQDALQYTIWVWNPNERSLPDFRWNDEALYYPGDEYVDVIGLTGYNTGTYYEGEKWRSFDEIYQIPYERAVENYNKPIMITEFASSSVGGSKGRWVQDMFREIDGYKKIKVAIWWSGRDLDADKNVARPYWLDETTELVKLFRKELSRSSAEN